MACNPAATVSVHDPPISATDCGRSKRRIAASESAGVTGT
jgi:hypothetical protein